MKRLMIQPYNFGSNQGYNFESELGPDGPSLVAAHHDYCGMHRTNYSVRIWEPGRMQVSTPGINQDGLPGVGDHSIQAPALPMRAEIHGIKGAFYFRFGGQPEDVGTWLDPVVGEPWEIQPTPQDTYYAMSGMPMRHYVGATLPQEQLTEYGDVNPGYKCPLFATLYRGTYKAIDDQAGWEIDTGPADDPDTLLELDITDPTVLESSRLDWWDMDMVRFPHYKMHVVWDGDSAQYLPLPGEGNLHRYSMDLKTNKHLKPDQVLWLHFMTGTVMMPVARPAQPEDEFPTGAPTLSCAYYQGHAFSCSVQASMLVTAKVAV